LVQRWEIATPINAIKSSKAISKFVVFMRLQKVVLVAATNHSDDLRLFDIGMKRKHWSNIATRVTVTKLHLFVPHLHQSLLKFARKHRLCSARAAHGACFHAAVQLSERARELGLEEKIRFLHWRVHGDKHFREHWALSFRSDHVLDATAVQVDGNANPLRKKVAYPPHFGAPREYPLNLILRHFAKTQLGDLQRVPAALIWRVHLSMVVYDLRCSSARWTPAALVVATGQLAELVLIMAAQGVSNWAHRRLDVFLSRLARESDTSAAPQTKAPLAHHPTHLRAMPWRAAQCVAASVAKAICAIFFLGVPV